jgi:hypothetical protein
MKDLRLVGHEVGSIQLETLEGEKFRLPVDENVRLAVKSAMSDSQQVEPISPREIQDRIRNGSSVEDIIALSGANQSYVEKFAKPVLDELRHMVDAALAIRITIAGDRFNDEVQEEFGKIIESRLFASGARKVSWSSKRVDVGTWHVMADFELGEADGLAVWLFEPRKFQLSPENETAVTLSNHDSNLDGPIPKLRPVIATKPRDAEQTATVTPLPFTRETRASETEITDSDISGSDVAPNEVPAAFRKTEAPVDQLAELQRLREEQAAAEADIVAQDSVVDFPEPAPEPVEDNFATATDTAAVETEPAPALDAQPSPDVAEEEHETTPTAEVNEADEGINAARDAKRGRAAMPSWDEIVFGTKSDD